MKFRSNFPLFIVVLSLFVASTLAIRFPNQDSPIRELEQCVQRCQSQSGKQQLECVLECAEDIPSEQRRSNEAGPQRELQQCIHSCQREQGGEQQIECVHQCVEKVGKPGSNQYSELEQCVQRRCGSRQSRWERAECVQHCIEEIEGGGRKWVISDDDLLEAMINPYRPEQEQYEECRRDCERRGSRGQSQQWQCQKRCQEEFERESHGRRHFDNQAHFEPFQICQQRCQGKSTRSQRTQCQKQCMDQFQGERGLDIYVDDSENPDIYGICMDQCRRLPLSERDTCTWACSPLQFMVENPTRDPQQQKYRQCQQRCQRQGRGFECQMKCQQEFQGQRGQGSRFGFPEESENEYQDPQKRFQECQQRCQMQPRQQKMQCQKMCRQQLQTETGISPRQTILDSFLDLTAGWF
ncbi:unnamed protein product [Amaranthus hypochondriacus]